MGGFGNLSCVGGFGNLSCVGGFGNLSYMGRFSMFTGSSWSPGSKSKTRP